MNINNYEKFNSRINLYQFLYGFLIISITFIVIIGLFYFKNTIEVKFEGIVLDNVLEIKNLSLEDINIFLESKKVLVEENNIKKEIIDIKENNDKYFIKIKLDDFKLDNTKLDVICILKEESLYQFIINIMKGDS